MTAPPGTRRADVYRNLEVNRVHLRSSIEGLAPGQMVVPAVDGWSLRDILTHITSWEELMLADLQRMARGHEPALACNAREATDLWNDLLMSVRGRFAVEQVLAELDLTHDAVMAALDDLDDGQFSTGILPGICQVTAFHDWEHASEIKAWREGEGL